VVESSQPENFGRSSPPGNQRLYGTRHLPVARGSATLKVENVLSTAAGEDHSQKRPSSEELGAERTLKKLSNSFDLIETDGNRGSRQPEQCRTTL
jgi:hypothetical protein